MGLLNSVVGICGAIPPKVLDTSLLSSAEALINNLDSYSCMGVGQIIVNHIWNLAEKFQGIEEASWKEIKKCGNFFECGFKSNKLETTLRVIDRKANYYILKPNLSDTDKLDKLCLEYIRQNAPDILEVEYVPGMPGHDVELKKRHLEEQYVRELRHQIEMYVGKSIIQTYLVASGAPSEVIEKCKQEIVRELSNIQFDRENDGNFEKDLTDLQPGVYVMLITLYKMEEQ